MSIPCISFISAFLLIVCPLSSAHSPHESTSKTNLIGDHLEENSKLFSAFLQTSNAKSNLRGELRQSNALTAQNGMTGNQCNASTSAFSRCISPRSCFDVQTETQGGAPLSCTDESTLCLCIPPSYTFCNSSTNCVTGERCYNALSSSASTKICVSCTAVLKYLPRGIYVDGAANSTCLIDQNEMVPGSSSSPNSFVEDAGYNFEPCNSTVPQFCNTPRVCTDLLASETNQAPVVCTNSSIGGCACIDFNSPVCADSRQCPVGERCVTTFGVSFCISCKIPPAAGSVGDQSASEHCPSSPAPIPSIKPSPTSSLSGNPTTSTTPIPSEQNIPPCVAVDALQKFKREELVYKNDIRSPVLCDDWDNCATPGHIVVHDEAPMMMKRYCKIVRCVKRIRMVNSPKVRKGLRFPSKSREMEFTAFSARYETRVEEVSLKIIIKMGM